MRHVLVTDELGFSKLDIAINESREGLNDLASVIHMILGTNARWREPYPQPEDKQGWSGDALPIGKGGQLLERRIELGTCLWTLHLVPMSNNTVNLAKRAILEGMQWLVDDGIVREKNGIVLDIKRDRNRLLFRVELYSPDDESLLSAPYEHIWSYGAV